METEINNISFSFIDRLFERQKDLTGKNVNSNIKGSSKERGVLDISKWLTGGRIYRASTSENVVVSIVYEENNLEIGFENDVYKDFCDLINKILSLPDIDSVLTFSSLETIAFRWMIEVKQKKVAHNFLLAEVRTKLEEIVKEYEFFFPITNLEIVDPFKLGNSFFTYFTKKEMDDLSDHYQNVLPKKEFDSVFREKYQGVPIAHVVMKAEKGKAEEIALMQAEISVDCLKMIFLNTVNPASKIAFDLNHRLNFQYQSSFLSKNKLSMEYIVSMNFADQNKFKLDNELLKLHEREINFLDKFVRLNRSDELYKMIINSIGMYSFALSISDLHKRAIEFITIAESLLLDDKTQKGYENITVKRLSKIIPPPSGFTLKVIFRQIYDIRNKMIHKARRRSIDFNLLHAGQFCLFVLLVELINENIINNILDKGQLIAALDSRSDLQ